MLIAEFQNVTTHYGAQVVLNGTSFKIDSGQKLGLIGANGSGKTTILRVLLGQESPSSGDVFLASGIRVGYVPQYAEFGNNDTVIGTLMSEHRRLTKILREEEDRLAQASGAELDKVMRAYQQARDDYDRIDGDGLPHRARTLLQSVGLVDREDQDVESLSGGEKNVLSMAQALLADPDLLLLDEPGNHLDYLGIAWLEDFLVRFKGAVLIVSHSRYLLDRVVGGLLWLEGGRVQHYRGGYSDFRATRLRELMSQQSEYIANQKRLARLEALVKRFEEIARRIPDPGWGKRLRARKSQLARERDQAVERPELGGPVISPEFSTEATRADIALEIRGYERSFGDVKLFEGAEIGIAAGERVALVGPNGSGKTTLLKDIIEKGSWEAEIIRIGPSMEVGYASQQQEVLGEERSVVDEIRSTVPVSRDQAFSLLRRFAFGREDMDKRVADLSGGERNRLQLGSVDISS